jgi:hypothetical protein
MKRSKSFLSNRDLGSMLILGLVLQFVLPVVKLGSFDWIATLISLFVAIILLFHK